MVVIVREMIHNTGEPRMHISAAKIFSGDLFARCSFHERRAPLHYEKMFRTAFAKNPIMVSDLIGATGE